MINIRMLYEVYASTACYEVVALSTRYEVKANSSLYEFVAISTCYEVGNLYALRLGTNELRYTNS